MTIKNVNTIDEYRKKIVRNSFKLPFVARLATMAIGNTVSSDF